MLSELRVTDLGVIESASLLLGPGLTAVTGETGAGKTMIVGAIELLMGGRADPSMVRAGADEAVVEGRFVFDGLAGLGEPGELVVRRVVPRDGRSRAYLDGTLATASALAERGADLVDLHGQHAHQSLLKSSVQRAALDQYGGIDTQPLASLLDELRATERSLEELGGDDRARAREIDLLRHQLAEIESAGIVDRGDDRRLDDEESVLADATAHRDAAAETVTLLDADGPVASGVSAALAALDGRIFIRRRPDSSAGWASAPGGGALGSNKLILPEIQKLIRLQKNDAAN